MLDLPLPGSLLEVATEIGVVNALAMSAIYGGQEIYIPHAMPDVHPICVVFGREVADRLSFRFGGGTISLAKADRVSRSTRDAAILEERKAKSTVIEIARRHGLSERRVWGILKSVKEA